jgi:class 3 adenylate cyclase/tetratricopeptide (TPR) repeat protein
MECPSCKADVPDGSKFCNGCGAAAPIRCAACGAQNRAGSKFCSECGASLAAPTAGSLAAAPTVASALQQPVSSAERRQLTVMFCDLVGSTALSTRLDPEDTREIISAYHRCCAETITRSGGFVAKYMGDGLLTYFGYPQAHEDDAERAVRTGLALVAEVGKLTVTSGYTPQIRVGIATGLVVVGDLIGEGAAQEQGVVGETPNLAARLQALAAPGQVVISAGTHCLAEGLFAFHDLGAVALKGFAEPVPAYVALSATSIESRFEARHKSGLMPPVGRGEELDLLMGRWRQVQEGEGRVVLLSGEAGIGKSRLLRALREEIGAGLHALAIYSCAPHLSASPLAPVIQQLYRTSGLETDQTPDAQRRRLEAFVEQHSLAGDALPLLATLLGVPTDADIPQLDWTPQRQKESTLVLLIQCLAAEARRRPLLLLFEDLHWIDPSSLEFLDLLVDQIATFPILAVLSYRPDFTVPWPGAPHITSLRLRRLSTAAAMAIVGGITGTPLPRQITEQIVARADGIPLFIEELTKAVVESGRLKQAATAWLLDEPLAPVAIPLTLHDSLMARLDRLGNAKSVAQIGAVVGRVFTRSLIAEIDDRPVAELDTALRRLTDAGLIVRQGEDSQGEDSYAFKHALVRDAAHESLLLRRRRELHGRVADALVGHPGNFPEVLAGHYAEAMRIAEAIDHWKRAGDMAVARSANIEAIDHLENGLRVLRLLPDTPDRAGREVGLQTLLGVARMAVQGYAAPDVQRAYGRAHELCRQLGDTPQLFPVLRGLYVYHLLRGELPEAHALGHQLVEIAEGTGDDGQALEANFALGQTFLFHKGDLATASRYLAAGAALYDLERHRTHAFLFGQDPGVFCLGLLAWTRLIEGRLSEAQSMLEAALALAERVRHPLSAAAALMFAALAQVWLRHMIRAEQYADRLIAMSTEQALPFFAGMGNLVKGAAEMARGAEGMKRIEEGMEMYAMTGTRFGQTVAWDYAARASLQLGRPEAAGEYLREVMPHALSDQGEAYIAPELLRTEALVHGALGDTDGVEACLRRALVLAEGMGAAFWRLRAACDLACLWRDQGKRAEARALLAPLYGWFTEGFDTLDLKDAKGLLDGLS